MSLVSAEFEALLSQGNYDLAVDKLIEALVLDPNDNSLIEYKKALQTGVDSSLRTKMDLYDKFNSFLPKTFTIETALACNLKCPECAIGADMISRTKGYLKLDRYHEIAEKIKPYAQYLYLHLWGEPMLNKKIFEMVEDASKFCRTNISTNATILTQEKAEQLIAVGVSEVIVSIDGFTQEVYEKYRVGGNVDDAFRGLTYLVEANKKYGNRTQIYPQFIVFEHNQHEVTQFAEYIKSLGLNPQFKAPYIRQGDGQFHVSDYPEYRRTEYDGDAAMREAMKDCVNPKEVFTIHLDGSVVVCCHDYDKITNFGNIYENSVAEIWNKPEYRKFRWDIYKGEAPQFCIDYCMTYVPKTENKKDEPKPEEKTNMTKVNLCSGSINVEGYVNIDIFPGADLIIDLEAELLPFENNSVDALACISAINYFDKKRGQEIINDVYRVLKPGGVARFATQDLRMLAEYYVNNDTEFFFQKGQNGKDRFPGETIADKFNNWFYGFESQGKYCKFVFDFETLALMFEKAGFEIVERKDFLDSQIDEVDQLDNRPEQMFFLEAVKIGSQTEVVSEEKKKLLNWTALLEKEEYNEISQAEFEFIFRTLEEGKRFDDIIKLIQKYGGRFVDNAQVPALIENYRKLNAERHAGNRNAQANLNFLAKYNTPSQQLADDNAHLDACMNWLYNAASVKNNDGVSAMYDPVHNDWLVSYPETTGYIIPNLVTYAKFTGKNEFFELAEKLGDWEIDIQWSKGGIGEPYGVYGQKPRVFNTSQVMLGWLALYNATKKESYLIALKKAANWLVSIQEKEGFWKAYTYQGPRSYHVRTAWALFEMFYITGDENYSQAVEDFVNWAINLVHENGWIEQTSLTEPGKPWTHLTGYTLTGLLKIAEILPDSPFRNSMVEKLNLAASNIANYYNTSRLTPALAGTLPGTFDKNWQSADQWSCITGDAQIEYFLRKMNTLNPDLNLTATVDNMLDSLKRLQVMDQSENPAMQGAMFGSYPVQGQYCAFSIPNWGVKFMADSLIQRIGFELDHYLG